MNTLVDIVQLHFKAGQGGDGWVSFRREKFITKGGPDGGDGGDGGSIILRATRKHATLAAFSGVKTIEAKKGQTGAKRQRHGRAGEDVIIEVPLGTIIWQVESRHLDRANKREKYFLEKETDSIPLRENVEPPIEFETLHRHRFTKKEPGEGKVLLVRMMEDGQEFELCKGGRGGRGNVFFKSPSNTTPLGAEFGGLGQERLVVLELELLADVGLVGLPNAGKSTFISRVTKARPKIANYPFTTIRPNLGVWELDENESVVVADIPGLIEGASVGKGLGHDFLRHIKACRVLFFFVYLTEEVAYDETTSEAEKAEQVWQQYLLLAKELEDYNVVLTEKPTAVVLNKTDIYTDELIAAISKKFKKDLPKGVSFQTLSAATAKGFKELVTELKSLAG
jgi:GTP-binding protein